ncbi:hypothetical protein ACIQPQ_04630 [Streptomyces sp. NPDC091281]|uniref:hypothetical protein n=1 Tax=Streptomyces sp. NPDC091281 TaxID=3365985 RepID=UPI0037F6700A
MSNAFASTELSTVVPDVSAYGYPGEPTGADLGLDTDLDVDLGMDVGLPDLTDLTEPLTQAAGHAVDQLQDMIVPALIGLADLSGALMVTRLALRGTEALAAFNNKVAAEQEAMSRRQASLETGSACWRRAAETAAGINARITVLGLEPSGPGDPPLPAPVAAVGVPLDLLWRRMAATDRAVRVLEARRAARATARLPSAHAEDSAHADWYDRLRERRRAALLRYAEGGPEPTAPTGGTGTAAAAPPSTGATEPPPPALTEEDVLREGADLLAGLPLAFSSASRDLIDDCLLEARRAVGRRPTAVRRYLDEASIIARKESERALESERVRRDAALRLDVLRAPAPAGVEPLPEDPAAVAVLERALRDGVAPAAADDRTVRQALVARSTALQRAYLVAALRRATEGWGAGSTHARADAEHWDFAPAAWAGHYWLRVRLTATGQARVFTMRRALTAAEAADPETVARWAAQDAERCAESAKYVEELGVLTEAEGVRAEFTWSTSKVHTGEPAPGLTATSGAQTGGTGRATGTGSSRTAASRRTRRPAPRARRHDD